MEVDYDAVNESINESIMEDIGSMNVEEFVDSLSEIGRASCRERV